MNEVDLKFFSLLKKIRNMSLDDIFNNIKSNFSKVCPEIQKSIADYLNKFQYWGILDLENGNYEEIYEKAKSFYEHLDDYEWLYNRLGDYKSKKLLYAILNNWYCYDFETLSQVQEKSYRHYFDFDVIPKCCDEVFVDLGSYVGDTVLDFINSYGINSYRKIYCYEMTDITFARLKDNLSEYDDIIYKNKAVSDLNGISFINESNVEMSANTLGNDGNMEVQTVSLDDDIRDKITFLKMDIEGSEQRAILGAKSHIKNDHPKMTISVYHNNEDLWKIPKMVNSISSDYKFYLRSYGGNIFPTEIVLYCI